MSGKQTDYRVAVFGCGEVGKSALVNRFVNSSFRDAYVPTIEDTYRQVINCNKQVCTLEITDTTGSHQFPAMQQLCITKGHAFILVYSVTNKKSFEELINIHNQLFRIKMEELTQIPLMIVGNKSDDESNRVISTVQGQALAKRLGCGFIETSAKLNTNVTEMFQELLKMETRRSIALVTTTNHQSLLKRFLALSAAKQKENPEDDPTKKKGVFQFGATNGKVETDSAKKKATKAESQKQKKEEAKKAKEEAKAKKEAEKKAKKEGADEKKEKKKPDKEATEDEKTKGKCLVM